jgi:hypothetical protein
LVILVVVADTPMKPFETENFTGAEKPLNRLIENGRLTVFPSLIASEAVFGVRMKSLLLAALEVTGLATMVVETTATVSSALANTE